MSGPVSAVPPALMLIEGGAGRRRTTWCDRLPGFGLRQSASGRASWIVQTRMGGRVRTVTLGNAKLLSEHMARELARHVLLHAYTGHKPASDRQKRRTAPAFDAFVAEYWTKAAPRWKASTRVRNDEHRRCHLLGRFPGQFIDQIDTAAVRRWFVTISDECGPGTANRAASVLNNMMNLAERWGYREEGSNPCVGMKRNGPGRTARVIEPAEMARLGVALDDLGSTRPQAAAIIRLLLLTGCRVSEILGLRWGDVKGSRIHLRDAKAGPRTVWLGDEARNILSRLPRTKSVSAVFWNARTSRQMASPVNFWRALIEAADLPPTRLHDLRHTFASYGARGQETMPMIGRLLGHRRLTSTGRYAHLDDASLLIASEEIGSAIEMMVG